MTVNSPLQANLILASRFENIEVAEHTLLDLCRRAGCAEEVEYPLVTALREAIANAVRHGNSQDPERLVRLEYRVHDGSITIRVEDEGEGFEPSAVPDPTEEANLPQPSGRGIFYMRRFMRRVEFGRTPGGGTAVVMERDLKSSDNDHG